MGKEYYQQRDLNDQQIAAQKEENQLDRDFQSAQWLEHFTMQNQYNESYNSPEAQVHRYVEAGLNPALAMGEGAATATTAANPSVPSGGHGLSSLNSVAQPSNFPQVLNSISALNDSFAKMFQSGAEGQQAIRLTQPLIDKAFSEKTLNEANSLASDYQRFSQEQKLPRELAELSARTMNLYSQAYLAESTGDHEQAERLVSIARRDYLEQLKDKTSSEAVYLRYLAARADKLIDSMIELRQASANQANASAANQMAQAKTTNALRNSLVTINEAQARISHRDDVFSSATQTQRLELIDNAVNQAYQINQKIGEEIRKLATDNDWNGVEHALGALGSAVNMSMKVRGLDIENMNALTWKERNDIYRDYVSELKKRNESAPVEKKSKGVGDIFEHISPEDREYYERYYPSTR